MFRGTTGRLLLAGCLSFLFLEVLFLTCNATDTNICATSCGHLLNISYPFRFANDPQGCGEDSYTLNCENNVPVLYLFSGRYYVQEINYHNFTIRLVDDGVQKDNCSSLPHSSLIYSYFSLGGPYAWYYYKIPSGLSIYDASHCVYDDPEKCLLKLSQAMVWITCPNPVDSLLYVDTAPCTNGSLLYHVSNSSVSQFKTHSYIIVEGMKASDLMESCRVDMVMLLPNKHYKNMSYKDIHNDLAYGFDISWYNTYCPKNCTMGCFADHKNRTSCIRFLRGMGGTLNS
ncbi:hypothetical protein Tsubulata_000102 [Turnera subulata]|uniref:Wall-associated receptor kinase galacturonan-binding domain-containing protein n=1 Tax=Turnera subulata TaxID=218843 RepID=A0A9Q0FJE2_9ROSI|nr:hypothetical protein Tsubulata_000102 [Turnera subulata]